MTKTEHLILNRLEEVIEYPLHLFWDIESVILSLKNVVGFRGNQRLPFRLNGCQIRS